MARWAVPAVADKTLPVDVDVDVGVDVAETDAWNDAGGYASHLLDVRLVAARPTREPSSSEPRGDRS
jgi:hypothetical protein